MIDNLDSAPLNGPLNEGTKIETTPKNEYMGPFPKNPRQWERFHNFQKILSNQPPENVKNLALEALVVWMDDEEQYQSMLGKSWGLIPGFEVAG